MSLTIGNAPFGRRGSGSFNFDTGVLQAHTLYVEDCVKRLRAVFAGETVADSRSVKRLHETGLSPVYYFPESDVRSDCLVASDQTTHCPFKGDAGYWSVVVGDRVADNAIWSYPEPLADAPRLTGYLAFRWDAMDAWYEEDELVFGHLRDPYHRVDVLNSSRHVRVAVNGETVAETDRPRMVFETGLPIRYYIPRIDVHGDALIPSQTRTRCPYKGEATYWCVRAAGEIAADVCWEYPEPLPEASKLPETLCFQGAQVDVEVDGQRQP